MKQKQKTYLNWSGGKDAALSLFFLLQDENIKVDRLLTTVNIANDRISMHGVRRSLLEKQSGLAGIPLLQVDLPEEPDMETYNRKMAGAVNRLKKEGFSTAAFGDIFLEDLRKYREDQLKSLNIDCIFPIWKKDTKMLMNEFIRLGFKAVVVAVNEKVLDPSFLGRELGERFLADLPSGVDPCGENGEFHTFCYDGPIFKNPVQFSIGEKVRKTYKSPVKGEDEMGFWFCDLN